VRAIVANVTPSLPRTARIGAGGGRLVPALVTKSSPPGTSVGAGALTRGWHDTERNVDCSFTLASDAKLRCLPTGSAATIFFTDATCQSPSRVAVRSENLCTGTPAGFVREKTAACPSTTRVFAVGTEPRSLGAASTETAPGRCASVAGVMGGLDATEADPTMFVEGVMTTE
jgi:hypothetical protein